MSPFVCPSPPYVFAAGGFYKTYVVVLGSPRINRHVEHAGSTRALPLTQLLRELRVLRRLRFFWCPLYEPQSGFRVQWLPALPTATAQRVA